MHALIKGPSPRRRGLVSLLLLFAGGATLVGCGGGASSTGILQAPSSLSGNWQFNMATQLNPDPTKPSFTGGLQGGFLLETDGSIKGAALYTIMTQPPLGSGGIPTECNSGTDQITGTISGNNVTLTAASAGAPTYTFTGTLSFDGSTMTGSYTSTDGAGCGIAATQAWSATLVPPLTGPIQGTFQSTGGSAGLNGQYFVVAGALSQGNNFGTGSTTVTGNINFVNPVTNVSDYSCIAGATVNGLISGNSVSLQIIGADGSTIGQIGTPEGSGSRSVTYDSTQNGYVLESLAGAGYAIYAPACGGGSDSGNVCLGVNTTTAFQVPITSSLAPAEPADSLPAMQTAMAGTFSGSALRWLTADAFP